MTHVVKRRAVRRALVRRPRTVRPNPTGDVMRSMFILSVVLALASSAIAGPGRAPVTSTPPACSPAQCRARAAFAFEQLAAASKCEKVAPAPKAKACPCGVGCECAAGVCPACPESPTVAPAATKAEPAKSVAYYREVWSTDAKGARVRELVPVYGDVPLVLPSCANGRCPLPR